MRLLLDTQVFLWFLTADGRLRPAWSAALCDPANDVFLSVVSVWEACVKYYLNKLPLPEPAEVYLPRQRERHGISSLPLSEACLQHLGQIPPVHRDPFDRMLICQALQEGLTLVTADEALRAYPYRFCRMPKMIATNLERRNYEENPLVRNDTAKERQSMMVYYEE